MTDHNNSIIDEHNNIKEFSVTEISNKIKWLLENNFSHVRIKGEISGLKIATSGHGYFSLKDANAVIAAICWRHSLARVNFELTEGLEVVAIGKVTAYAGQSKYQISVDSIEPAGVGAFMKILSERRKKFEAEGLFAKDHKKNLPFLPKKIGIVTSLTGAVIKDIIHRISDRFPVHLCIWPVAVQGENSAREVAAAIKGFNDLSQELRPDLLIVARGGGSIEDLWSFNEEIVVRAAYNSEIPIISAVGHETDYSLLDLVADLRAPTPTAAAEFAVPVMSSLQYTVSSLYNNIMRRISMNVAHKKQILESYNRILQYPISYLNSNIQKLDDLSLRLSGSLPNLLKQKKSALRYVPINRFNPIKIINYKYLQLSNFINNLTSKKSGIIKQYEYKLDINKSLISSLDYEKVLKRGYTMLKNQDGVYLSSIFEVKKARYVNAKMKDGEVRLSLE